MRSLAKAALAAVVSLLSPGGCGVLDNAGDLDVLSDVPGHPSSAGPAIADASALPDAAEVPDAMPSSEAGDDRDAAAEGGAGSTASCLVDSQGCTACAVTNSCPVEWTACIADLTCLHAVQGSFQCICGAQFGEAGAVPDCQQEFVSSGPLAQILSTCLAARCKFPCGL